MLTLHYIKTTNFLFIKKGRGLKVAIRKNNEEKLLWNPNIYQLTKKNSGNTKLSEGIYTQEWITEYKKGVLRSKDQQQNQ